MANAEHHFVPAFLLREWQSGSDEKLTSFRWSRGQVVATRFKAKSVAKRRHLYSTGVAEGRPVKEVAAEMTTLTAEELDRLLDPRTMTEGGVRGR